MARLRNTVIFGVMPQVMFFVGVTLEPLPLPWFYMILFFALVAQLYFYERDNRVDVLRTDEAQVRNLPPQIAIGAVIGVAVTAPLALLAPFRIGPAFGQEFVVQVVFVGFVETFDLIVTVGTLPRGDLIWPFKFALEHWYVRAAILSGSLVLAGFSVAYTALFAVLFFLLYDARREHGPWFGAVTSWSAHVAVNLMLIMFPLAIFGFEFLPLAFGG